MPIITVIDDAPPPVASPRHSQFRANPPPREAPRRSMKVGSKVVSYVGRAPTQAEVSTFLAIEAAKRGGNGSGVREQRKRALDALAASDPVADRVVEILKIAGLI